jgi:hypothetical protein
MESKTIAITAKHTCIYTPKPTYVVSSDPKTIDYQPVAGIDFIGFNSNTTGTIGYMNGGGIPNTISLNYGFLGFTKKDDVKLQYSFNGATS